MCWSMTATAAMVAGGAAATAVTMRRGEAPVVPIAIGYFTLMEGLQLVGYLAIDQCGTPANALVTLLSYLHIAFQPLVINAFAMHLIAVAPASRLRPLVYTLCGLSALVMVLQVYPFPWAGSCEAGANLCGAPLCTRHGSWHLAWDVPYNGLMVPLDSALGLKWGFPTYMLTVFVLPAAYGAWRFALFHALAGPILAGQLTNMPNEVPAIWCLFSIGIALTCLIPPVRRFFGPRAAPAG